MNIILDKNKIVKVMCSVPKEQAGQDSGLNPYFDPSAGDVFLEDCPQPVGLIKPRFIGPSNWREFLDDALRNGTSPPILWEEAASQTELDAIQAQKESQQAQARLDEIDRESIRALRAVATGTQTKADTDKLAALEAEVEQLRPKILK